MNKSNFVHAAFALIFQLALLGTLFTLGPYVTCGAGAVLFFLAREQDQRQHNLQKASGRSLKDMKPWEGLDILDWPRDSQLDLLMPVVAVAITSMLAYFAGV